MRLLVTRAEATQMQPSALDPAAPLSSQIFGKTINPGDLHSCHWLGARIATPVLGCFVLTATKNPPTKLVKRLGSMILSFGQTPRSAMQSRRWENSIAALLLDRAIAIRADLHIQNQGKMYSSRSGHTTVRSDREYRVVANPARRVVVSYSSVFVGASGSISSC